MGAAQTSMVSFTERNGYRERSVMDESRELGERLRTAILGSRGVTKAAFRRSVHDRAVERARGGEPSVELPSEWATFVDAVSADSNAADVDALLDQGHSEDSIFEVAVAAAVAAGLVRMQEGLRAVDET